MKYNRIQKRRRQVIGAPLEDLLTRKKGKHSYKIATAILAVFVLHFVWQFSFIQKENLRMAEDAASRVQLDVAPVERQSDEKSAEVETDSIVKKAAVEETVKRVVPVKYALPENKRSPVEVKKKAVREPKPERLRRAEKLLTGF